MILLLCTTPSVHAEVSAGNWLVQGDGTAVNAAALAADPTTTVHHSAAQDYKVTSMRVLEGLTPGSYSLRAKARSSGGQPSVFVFAGAEGFTLARTSLPAANDKNRGAQEVVIPGIPVPQGRLKIGLYSNAKGGQWAELSDIQLQREAQPRPFLAGGDVSVLPLMERMGARYFDAQGHAGDALQILRANGHSIARLRLYEHTGPGTGVDGYYWPAGSMDLPDLLRLARRVKAQGMQIELTLHYSDFWTNSKTQRIPGAWQKELDPLPDEAARLARLRELVAARTREVILALQAQGTTPEFVSLGNEIEAGMLYPYGAATPANWPRLAELLKAGYAAVKAVNPSSRVVLHLDDGGNLAKYRDWFDHARANGVQWDVIGASYYPFWTKKTVAQLAEFSRTVTTFYDCDMLVMEVGFNFHPTLANGYAGQLENNGPYPASMSSPAGQRAFMDEMLNTLKRNDRVLGLLYWDPVMIATPGVGWALHEGDAAPGPNVVANTTLFDFRGRALPVLSLWRDHAAAMPLPTSTPVSALATP
ncbi:glycoside hydrolase family 53 protein [Roseateles koreensis]|uniref:Arabinogalactan endo-beta-1,4-galactanase n=1 Tax=Roseateles koreensis TaxID=2987526 RepID=A0ABT5KVJ7_9BURK|nr:glycosyl hydrolase 53 family protein [Roseateles koreensis]MDC8786822.1 glycosyl hydrolase 53 family protein [Roseateles koreensis]